MLAIASTARADTRRVGIVVTVKVNVTAEAATALAGELGEVIRSERPVDVLAGVDVDRRLPAEGVAPNCHAVESCRQDLARRLDADELLMLVIVDVGGKTRIDATWVNIATGKVVTRPAITLTKTSDRRAVFRQAVPRLLPHIAKKKPDGGSKIVVVPVGKEERGGRRFTRGTWIATGIAVAAGIAGGVFAISAQGKFSSLEDDNCRVDVCEPARIDSLDSHALAADVLLGVSLASAVTAAVLYIRSDPGPASEQPPVTRPPVSLVPLPGGVAVNVGGRF